MKETLYEHILAGLERGALRYGSLYKLSTDAGMGKMSVYRWVKGDRGEEGTLAKLATVLEMLGARIVFPEDVDADFSQDLAEKTEEIRRLRQELEKKAEEKFILEGRLRAYKEMMEEYRERLEAKENPAGAGKGEYGER